MSFKLSGTLPPQTVNVKLPSYSKPDHSGESRTDYRGAYAGGEAHVVEYGGGGKDVYINWD